jgi:hypothetical protein
MATQTATRRLAAILAADVVGYSRLMSADEEGTLERLKPNHRQLIGPKIREHHGRIVKTTGDGPHLVRNHLFRWSSQGRHVGGMNRRVFANFLIDARHPCEREPRNGFSESASCHSITSSARCNGVHGT